MTKPPRRFATLGVIVAALTLTPAVSAAVTHTATALNTAAAVVRATDRAPIIEAREGSRIDGHSVYASYSDHKAQVAATYLEGKLVQGAVDATSYAASGACFERERQPGFVGLSRIAASLVPLPSPKQRVSYTLQGRTLRWLEPATKQHSAEHGTLTFNGRDRIVTSHTAPYTAGRSRAAGQTITFSYPAKLPRSVPASLPGPVCKTTSKRAR